MTRKSFFKTLLALPFAAKAAKAVTVRPEEKTIFDDPPKAQDWPKNMANLNCSGFICITGMVPPPSSGYLLW